MELSPLWQNSCGKTLAQERLKCNQSCLAHDNRSFSSCKGRCFFRATFEYENEQALAFSVLLAHAVSACAYAVCTRYIRERHASSRKSNECFHTTIVYNRPACS